MRTTFVVPPPVTEELIARRKALGQDLYDEVWEGVYHVAAAPNAWHSEVQARLIRILGPLADRVGLQVHGPSNIGGSRDFRVPDLAFLRGTADPVWQHTAAIVVEVVSPGDESRLKFAHYFRMGVEEFLIVDPGARTVEWFARGRDVFTPTDASAILGISATELHTAIDWPA
ncbi:MAG: Uma2 family endonuclease [Chloroflexi bacterium]|nr:Uma2 family endonuclease [Chloroflexota bacterium]